MPTHDAVAWEGARGPNKVVAICMKLTTRHPTQHTISRTNRKHAANQPEQSRECAANKTNNKNEKKVMNDKKCKWMGDQMETLKRANNNV